MIPFPPILFTTTSEEIFRNVEGEEQLKEMIYKLDIIEKEAGLVMNIKKNYK